MTVFYGSTKKHIRPVIYGKPITMKFDEQLLNEFKAIVGKGYQTKIRELVQDYVDKYKRDLKDKQ